MRYNTGNPVGPDGSSSPFDLHDNAGNLDIAVNGTVLTWADRLGAIRKSWAGLQDQVSQFLIDIGYESVHLIYAAGVVVERPTQLVERNGFLYRVKEQADLPLTLTGDWSLDSPKLLSVYDEALRHDLSETDDRGVLLVGNANKVINISQWGCVSGADISVPLQAAADEADARGWPLALDIDSAIVTTPVSLPQRVIGLGCVITGDLKWVARKFASGSDFKCTNLLFDGFWNPDIKDIEVTNILTFRGLEPDFGGFYSVFQSFRAGQIVLDASKQAINGNTFIGMNGNKPGGAGLLLTTYGAPPIEDGVQEAHANLFIGLDTSHSTGLRNEISDRNQTNFVIGGYAEHGALPVGDWHIGVAGMHIDGSSLPVLRHYNHCLGMTHHSPATAGDSLSASPVNACVGGDWSIFDSTGKPPCFEASYAASLSPRSETPYGYTAVWGGAATGAFQYLQCRFSTPTGRFSGTFILECPNGLLPYAIEISDGVMLPSSRTVAAANLGDGFYLFRISGEVQKNTPSVVRFYVTAPDGLNRGISLGAAFLTPLKAAFMPTFTAPAKAETSFAGGIETKRGQVSRAYVSGGPSFDISVTYGAAFLASNIGQPSISLMPATAYRGNASKYEILTATISGFTARVYYTGEWAGEVFWRA